jgi:hypothetical protein
MEVSFLLSVLLVWQEARKESKQTERRINLTMGDLLTNGDLLVKRGMFVIWVCCKVANIRDLNGFIGPKQKKTDIRRLYCPTFQELTKEFEFEVNPRFH